MPAPPPYSIDEAAALQMDASDPLSKYRERFHLPCGSGGQPLIYLVGNSLGLQPKTARARVEQELRDWADLGVDGHHHARTPWYSYHETFRERGARLVGARPGEVVMMNALTVNLHLLMVSFYRPTRERYRILIEESAFPSDLYAVQTQALLHGFSPADALLLVKPRAGEQLLRIEDIEALLADQGHTVALVLLGGVNYLTGQWLDIPRIAVAAKRAGAVVGLDLAHAAGNVPLRLHDWGVDFASWCSYKYLNSGPGAIAGAFVHESQARRADLLRLGGWWGNDPATRFSMDEQRQFVPVSSVEAWQLSNPPILMMAALSASLDIFDEVGMERLREKSLRLTGYLEYLLEQAPGRGYEIVTPRDPAARGCQLSLLARRDPQALRARLQEAGVVCDFRPPNVIRAAPVPLYNTFHEVWRFAQVLSKTG